MGAPNFLSMECAKCKVAATCPRNGASPIKMPSGKMVLCNIIGGYGREPVKKEILSAESLVRSEKDGPCITIAEVPVWGETGGLIYKPTTIFHQAVLHPREMIGMPRL